MKRMMSLIAVVTALVVGCWVFSAMANEPMSKGLDRSYELSEMTGKIVVNPQGEYLGRVRDFVFDPEGHISFAILSQGGMWRMGWKSYAIPFTALNYDKEKKHFVLDISREKLGAAPAFKKDDLSSREWAADVYKYYGLQPYWTEGGSGSKAEHSMGGLMEKHGAMGGSMEKHPMKEQHPMMEQHGSK